MGQKLQWTSKKSIYTDIWMHSRFRYSFSKTFSRMTTLPSATEVTSRWFPAIGAARLGTRKNQVMKTMKITKTADSRREIQWAWIKWADTQMRAAQMHQLTRMVPKESLSILIHFIG